MSGAEIVHPLPADAVEGWAATMMTAFLGDASGEDFQRIVEILRRSWDPERRWGAREGSRWVGTLGSLPNTLTVPGTEDAAAHISADALTMVTVAGTHRRRGLLTAMMTGYLREARERGDAVSVLWAAEAPIYGRFGYAPAADKAAYVLHPRRPGGRLEPAGEGRLRQLDAAELGDVGPAIFDAARRLRAGNIDRPARWWSRNLGLDGYPAPPKAPTYVAHEGPDGPDGFVIWTPSRPADSREHLGAVEVSELCAANDDAYRDLWAYLSGLDLVAEVRLDLRPVDEPARWLVRDRRALEQVHAGDGLWLRLLDVPVALSARRYAVPGRLVLEVVDDSTGGFTAGRYLLEGGPDGATCTRSTVDSPELRLDQRALAGVYLGGTSLRNQFITGLIDELGTGAVRLADAMFATPLAPSCATDF